MHWLFVILPDFAHLQLVEMMKEERSKGKGGIHKIQQISDKWQTLKKIMKTERQNEIYQTPNRNKGNIRTYSQISLSRGQKTCVQIKQRLSLSRNLQRHRETYNRLDLTGRFSTEAINVDKILKRIQKQQDLRQRQYRKMRQQKRKLRIKKTTRRVNKGRREELN